MSYSFDEICKFKAGESYWENSQYGSIRFTLKDDPVVTTKGEYTQVTFTAVDADGNEIEYLKTKGFDHYGPSISDMKEYYTWDEIQNELNKPNTEG